MQRRNVSVFWIINNKSFQDGIRSTRFQNTVKAVYIYICI